MTTILRPLTPFERTLRVLGWLLTGIGLGGLVLVVYLNLPGAFETIAELLGL